MQYLTKQDPSATGFTRGQIFDALVPATEGLIDYNPFILRNELGGYITTALNNKIQKFLSFKEIDGKRFYYLVNWRPELEIPHGYLPYISGAANGPYVYTHLYKILNSQKVFMCKTPIKKKLYNNTGYKNICPQCLQAAELGDLKSKYELLRLGYDQLAKQKNELQVKNNQLESQLLKLPINEEARV